MADDTLAQATQSVILRRRRAQGLDKLIGDAASVADVRSQVVRLAESDATVLIVGETGTGKELVARAVHYASTRAGFPFIAVNCAALPDTLLEGELFGHDRGAYTDAHATRQGLVSQAEKGTLFLDEVESLTARGQGVLLRVLQDRAVRPLGSTTERTIDVRFVAATNVDLAGMVERGTFRADLFYRLRVLWLEVPSLRARREDIPLLTRHFIAKHARRTQPAPEVSDAALRALVEYDWPGNVRELENAVIRALHLAENGRLEPSHLGLAAPRRANDWGLAAMAGEGLSLQESKRRLVETFERDYLTRVLIESHGNVTQAARRAKKERRELGKLLRKHGLNAKDFVRAV